MQPLHYDLGAIPPPHRLFGAFLDERYPILLDSSLPHREMGRYSYIVADPILVLRAKNGVVAIESDGRRRITHGDPFDHLRRLLAELRTEAVPGLPPFQGGAVGYFGYDLAQHVEALPRVALDDLGVPDMVVGVYCWTIAYSHLEGRAWLVGSPYPNGGLGALRRRMERALQKIEGARGEPLFRSDGWASPRIVSNFTRQGYLDAIARAKEYISAGDIYQVNLSQRFQVPTPLSPWELYCRLREVSPVPYSAFLELGDLSIASASPELFLRKEGPRVVTRPIKGTRPRGKTPEEDRRLAEELSGSEKDRAENVMIVDLLRNDLGRVCQVGSVRVPELFALESYTTVHHLVSTVEGTLTDSNDAISLLKACFPGGSVTGCPKIRAMEIIDELEPTRRGVYCGSIGYVGFDGNMDTSIVIRTVVVKDGQAFLQVGGAIVADSDPEAEFQETLDKARAAILALGGG